MDHRIEVWGHGKNLLSENKKAEKGQKLKKYQTDFNFS